MKDITILSVIPAELHLKLATAAKANDRSISKEIKRIIETHFNELELKKQLPEREIA